MTDDIIVAYLYFKIYSFFWLRVLLYLPYSLPENLLLKTFVGPLEDASSQIDNISHLFIFLTTY